MVMYAPLHFSLPQRYTYTLFSLGAIILALPTSRRMSHRIKMRCLPLLATGKWMMLIVKNANQQQSWKPTYSNQIIIYRKKAFWIPFLWRKVVVPDVSEKLECHYAICSTLMVCASDDNLALCLWISPSSTSLSSAMTVTGSIVH